MSAGIPESDVVVKKKEGKKTYSNIIFAKCSKFRFKYRWVLCVSSAVSVLPLTKNVWVTCGTADHLYLLTSAGGQRHMLIIYLELSNCFYELTYFYVYI